VEPAAIAAAVRLEGKRTLDMREWRQTVDAVDQLVAETIEAGLYVVEAERQFVVTDTFENGPALVESVRGWRGTRISETVSARVAAVSQRVTVDQEVRLRLLRAADAGRSGRMTSVSGHPRHSSGLPAQRCLWRRRLRAR
jgi:hypothetical protein